jgi:hypothetical protein
MTGEKGGEHPPRLSQNGIMQIKNEKLLTILKFQHILSILSKIT